MRSSLKLLLNPENQTTGNIMKINSWSPCGRLWSLIVLTTLGALVAPGWAQNLPPDLNAGADQTLPPGTGTVSLLGFASDADGSVAQYAWTKISGGTATITTPATAGTTVTGLTTGTYIFRLTVTDNQGGAAYDEVRIIVNATAGKQVVLTANVAGQIYRPDLSSFNIVPGDTIVIAAGDYPNGIIIGGFSGSATNPVIIQNQGLVTARQLSIAQAQYFRLTGSGSGEAYGFKIGNVSNSTGIAIGRATSDYEVERCEVWNSGVGFLFKIQPAADDALTQYPNWTINNVYVHDNYIHDTTGEGMYIGHTFPNADINNGNLIPVRMQNVKIYRNRVENAGWDGIQLSNARSGSEIFNNVVKNHGAANINFQQAGIQLGGNTTGKVYGNTVDTGTGPSLTAYGYGDVYLTKNVLRRGGSSGGQDMIYINSGVNTVETNPALKLHFLGNTLNEPINTAIRNGNYNSNTAAGEIRLNSIFDPLNRTLAQLIASNAGDVISGNILVNGDTTAPVVTITSPTSQPTYGTTAGTLNFSGTASDNIGVSQVTWSNDRGGSGTASGTTSWSVVGAVLQSGVNIITVTARDGANNSSTDTITVTYTASGGGTVVAAINCGKTTAGNFTGSDGIVYVPDSVPPASGGTATVGTSYAIAGTTDDTLFDSYRYGTHSYNIAVANGTYQVALRFADNATAVNMRKFNVAIEGTTVLTNFDIFAEAGTNTALDKVFTATVADGTLNLQFTNVTGNAKINAIVVRTMPTAQTLIAAINCGKTAAGNFTGADGTVYVPDSVPPASGGTATVGASYAIAGTTDDTLFDSYRYGTHSYNFSVTNGTYEVKLRFSDNATAANVRKFNVAIEGTTVLSNFDIFAQVGTNTVCDRTFTVPVSDGTLNIQFTNVTGSAKINAIVVKTAP
jgi:hypothetical protein